MVMDLMGGGGGDMAGGGGAPGGADLASMLGMGAPAPGGDPAAAAPGGGDAESQYQSLIDGTDDPEVLVNWAKMAVAKAISVDPDHEDKLLLEDTNSRLQKYLAAQQQMSDQAMGGAGAKALRKAYA